MRHAYFGRKLGRDINARKALLNNLASGVLENGKITTTLAKAKFARPYVEELITQAKKQKKLSRQRVLASVLTATAFKKLQGTLVSGFAQRPGGYTRIVKLNVRNGDAAPMARLELMPIEKQEKKEQKPADKAETKEVAAPAKADVKEKKEAKSNDKKSKN